MKAARRVLPKSHINADNLTRRLRMEPPTHCDTGAVAPLPLPCGSGPPRAGREDLAVIHVAPETLSCDVRARSLQ